MNNTFILDLGSGNSCDNDWSIVKEMIDQIADIDKKRKIILKWQLFKQAGNNVPLDKRIFCNAYDYAVKLGFKTTASVFDKESLDFLLGFDIPFVKLANNPLSLNLFTEIPENILIIGSTDKILDNLLFRDNVKKLCCISQYPALINDYHVNFKVKDLQLGISDHTCNWELFRTYLPEVYECHFKLENSTGLDAGEFARTPEQLSEIIDLI